MATENFADLMRKGKEVLSALHDEAGVARLEDLLRTEADAPFRICVAGGFSKGKSRLLNRLLGEDILPEGSLPVTTVLTEIRHGGERKLEHIRPDGAGRMLECSREALDRFSAGADAGDCGGTLRLSLPQDWLWEDNIVLHDTPGVDDLLSTRANTTFDSLEICDAALVTISAVAPLSLTEKALVDAHIRGRGMPRTALVLTGLDLVAEKDRGELASFLARKIRGWHADVEFWIAQDADEVPGVAPGAAGVVGIPAMRARIREWRRDPALAALRERRKLVQLRALLEISLAERREVLASLNMDAEARAKVLRAAETELRDRDSLWGHAATRFVSRHVATARAISDKLDDFASTAADEIAAGNEEDAAWCTRQKLREAELLATEILRKRLDADVRVLLEDIARQTGADVSGERIGAEIPDGLDVPLDAIREAGPEAGGFVQTAVTALQAAERFGPLLATKIPILAPLAPIIPAFARGIREFLENSLAEEAEARRRDELRRVVLGACFRLASQLQDATERAYEDTDRQIRELRRQWLEGRLAILKADPESADARRSVEETKAAIRAGEDLLGRLENIAAH